MKLEHIAVASRTEQESDEFFIQLLGMEKTRSFNIAPDLMIQFFGIDKEQYVIRYQKGNINLEVFITDDTSKATDIFTHNCLVLENRDEIIERAKLMGLKVIKVPRKDSGYYLFIKDKYENLYELK